MSGGQIDMEVFYTYSQSYLDRLMELEARLHWFK